ncbi:MAG: sodium:proton antiporter NhaD [Chitinispirillaceae bacterium]|nr:sodium:proton antiporter NhaD [Chitinispirillaceae bacterium]
MTIILVITFCAGYGLIAAEHYIRINKTATALLTGVLCWSIYIFSSPDKKEVGHQLIEGGGSFSGILYFLMGAMTIVELIRVHGGFSVITDTITTRSRRKLLWLVCMVTFFLSAVLDNMTTAIVMVSLVAKLLADKNDRMVFAGMIVIAANAGGAWTPIGDVTTTMLWIGGNISSLAIISNVFLPSVVCMLVPLTICSFSMGGTIPFNETSDDVEIYRTSHVKRNIVFYTGTGMLLFVPIFKGITQLPPFMGMLFGVGFLWVVVELLHAGERQEIRREFSVTTAIRNIDLPSVLFFLGILVCIAALESSGILIRFANTIDVNIKNRDLVVSLTGILSAIIDNVPLVASFMGMYDLTRFPLDHHFWLFLAYCAGTGGSLLVIGSAAGVVAMGLARLEFFWYLKNISPLAFSGYLAGALCYLGLERLW